MVELETWMGRCSGALIRSAQLVVVVDSWERNTFRAAGGNTAVRTQAAKDVAETRKADQAPAARSPPDLFHMVITDDTGKRPLVHMLNSGSHVLY